MSVSQATNQDAANHVVKRSRFLLITSLRRALSTHRLLAEGLLKYASSCSAARLGAACSPPDTTDHSAEYACNRMGGGYMEAGMSRKAKQLMPIVART